MADGQGETKPKTDNPPKHKWWSKVKGKSSAGTTKTKKKLQRLTGIDQVFIHGTGVAGFNPFIIGVATLSQRPEPSEVIEGLEKLAAHFPRFGQRVTHATRLFRTGDFEDVPDFHPSSVLTVVPQTDDDLLDPMGLERVIGEVMSAPWDMKQPLWRVTYIQRYHDEEGGQAAVVFCVHHTFSDAQGFFLDILPDYKAPDIKDKEKDPLSKRLRTSYRTARVFIRTGRRGLVGIIRSVPHLTPSPARRTRATTRAGAPLLQNAGPSAASSPTIVEKATPDATTETKVEPKGWRAKRRASKLRVVGHDGAMTRGFTIDEFKTCAKGLSVENEDDQKVGGDGKGLGKKREKGALKPLKITLNDVASAIVADCIAIEGDQRKAAQREEKARARGKGKKDKVSASELEKGLHHHHPKPKQGPLRRLEQSIAPTRVALVIPKSLRGPHDLRMHNLSTFMPTYLVPLAELDPTPSVIRAHVHRTSREITLVKVSNFPSDFFKFLRFCGAIPVLSPVPLGFVPHTRWNIWGDRVVRPIAEWVTPKLSSAVFTNVPVPLKEPIELRGTKMIKLGGLPPQGGYGSAAISLVSYGGEIRITCGTDRLKSDDGQHEYHDAARRFCERFEKRFEQYLEAAKQLQAEKDALKKKGNPEMSEKTAQEKPAEKQEK